MSQQAHPKYGWMTIQYARLNERALVIGWSCDYGFGQLTMAQNFTRSTNDALPMNDPNYWVYTHAPGVYLDTEAMGAEFVAEVMKAFFWTQERGESIPESIE